jgi:hypothetical protein
MYFFLLCNSENFSEKEHPCQKWICAKHGRCQVLRALTTRITVFRDMTPCCLVDRYRHFRGTCSLNIQGQTQKMTFAWASQGSSHLLPEGTQKAYFKSYTMTGSVVDTVAGYRLDNRWVGVQGPVEPRIFCSPCRQTSSVVHPASYPMGTGALSLRVKQLGREAEHSPPTSVEAKKMWIYTPTPPHAFMA